ncbi:MAG TPA: FixH family protein [Polyangiaceae bacterium]|jgi:hypothetical protein
MTTAAIVTPAVSPESTSRRSGLSWAWAPVILLGSMVSGLLFMMHIALDDPTFAVESNYYAKAVAWDGTQAQLAENRRLGFRLSLPERVTAARDGSVELRLTLRDAHGEPVSGALLTSDAFANAHAAEISALSWQELEPGSYAARVSARHLGVWVFRTVVTRGADRFTSTLRAEIVPASAP